ncbi:PPC domain-containing protein, partial [Candidatus Bipolaricaulota bacterium]|nr:PPC domain-containing protein [Candidatus Bipolaricaulota bacterium]
MGRTTVWFLVLCLAMVLLLGTSVFASEQNDAGSGNDAGDDRQGALSLGTGTFTGFLGDDDREDWYKIELERGAIVSVNLAVPETANFDLHLNPSGPHSIARSTYGAAGQDEAIYQYAVGQAGTCYIRVVLRDGEGEYQLTLGVRNQNDARSGQDASNEREGAYLLTPGTFTGFLGDDDKEDWYKIEDLGQGQILSIGFTVPETAMFSLDLYRGTSYGTSLRHVVGQTNTIQYVVGQSGTWYIEVKRSSGEGPYDLTIEVQNQDDAGSGQDASDEREGAYLLTAGTFTGFLGDDDDEDWYKIEDLGQGQILSINLTVPEAANFDLFPLLPPYMPEHRGTGQKEAIQYVPQQSGPQYIRVDRNSGKGEYQLTIEIQNQNDAGSGKDASDERGGAYPLTLGTFAG